MFFCRFNSEEHHVIENLLVLTTGGTLDKVYFDAKSHYQVGEAVIISVLKSMNLSMSITFQEICKKDSLEINEEDRTRLRQAILASSAEHVLITHGTDTMVDTAAALENITNKIIVITGAMQPAAFKETDAIFNIGTAMGALACSTPGIYIAMSGQVFTADSVFKNYETRRFELK
jgi:L-asparaginase